MRRKRITAKLKLAPTLVVIDNVRRRLESASLSAALTEPVWEDRELGASRMLRLPIRCTWLATANNPALSGEIARRVARIRLDAGVERPWERGAFRHDPLEAWAVENRGELLWALLTLVRGWLAAGKPPGQARMGRFQHWADTVGGILAAAGIPGFLGNREEVYALAMAEMEGWRAFVEIWWQKYGGQRVGTDKLFDLAKDEKLLVELRSGHSDRGARTALGMELSRLRDRVVGQWVIRAAGTAHGGGAAYRLDERAPQNADLRGKAEKGSPGSPHSPHHRPPSDLADGEPGEGGEPFSAPKRSMEEIVPIVPQGDAPELGWEETL